MKKLFVLFGFLSLSACTVHETVDARHPHGGYHRGHGRGHACREVWVEHGHHRGHYECR